MIKNNMSYHIILYYTILYYVIYYNIACYAMFGVAANSRHSKKRLPSKHEDSWCLGYLLGFRV